MINANTEEVIINKIEMEEEQVLDRNIYKLLM
jgi:hypothetical protein